MTTTVVTTTEEATRPDPGRPGSPRGASRIRSYRNDALLAGLLLLGSGVSALLYAVAGFYSKPAAIWVTILILLALNAPLVLRRRFPEIVALVIAASFIASQLLQVPELLFCNIALFVAIYSVGAWGENRSRATAVRGVIVVGMFFWLILALVSQSTRATVSTATPSGGGLSPFVAVGFIQIITNLLYFGAAWYFGNRAKSASRAKAALEQRTWELADERELNSRRAVIQERLRIARDLHDVVAHHVSVMGVQAGAARRVLDSDHDQVLASLTAIESNARTAVSELHRMLSTLRDEESAAQSAAGSSDDSPTTRGIAQLPDLISDAVGTGLVVDFSTVGEARPVPATTGLILYRVAQEALTNTLKHAGAASHVDLRLRYLSTAIEIELTDTGGRARSSQKHSSNQYSSIQHSSIKNAAALNQNTQNQNTQNTGAQHPGAPYPAALYPAALHSAATSSAAESGGTTSFSGSGLGHIGMRERVDAVGGTIHLGRTTRGGFVVRATIPTGERGVTEAAVASPGRGATDPHLLGPTTATPDDPAPTDPAQPDSAQTDSVQTSSAQTVATRDVVA